MKRVLVVLLALVMGAGLAVAADQAPPKWAAYVEGWAILYDQDGQAYLGPSWAADTPTGQFTDLTFSYSEANMGFSFVDEFDSSQWGQGTGTTAGLRNMSGWYSMFNGMLKVTAGKVRDGSYRPTSYIEGTSVVTRILNAEWGLLFQLMPVKGLSIGAAVKFPEAAAPQNYEHMLGFGLAYTMDPIGSFYLNLRTVDSGVLPDTKTTEIGAAAKITAIKALPLYLSFAMSIYNVSDPLYAVLFSTQYVMDALTVSLDAKFQYQVQFDYGNEVSIAYKVAPYTVGLNAGYGSIAFATGGSLGGLFVYPWVSVAVGSASSMKLGFILDTDGDDAGADVLKWSIPVRYIFSF